MNDTDMIKLKKEAKVDKCARCGRRYRGQQGWNDDLIAGLHVGRVCPDCQTDEERLVPMPSDDPDRDALYRQWTAMTCRWYRRTYPPGRNDLPDCLIDLYESGEFGSHSDAENPFNAQLFAVAIQDTWSSAEYPEARFMEDPERCVEMFQDARGHLMIPAEPVTLYRGVRDEFAARHMSWTGTLEVARWFADRYAHLGGASGGLVYRLTNVDPEHVLAQIVHGRGEDGRGEDEYVLDPFHLDERGDNGLIELIENHR